MFDAEASYVWTTLRRLGVHQADIQDVAQEVWITIHRRLGDFDIDRPVRPWLFGIAFRAAAGYRRLARHQHELLHDGSEPVVVRVAVSPQVEADLESRDAQRLVLQALSGIELDRRAVLVMHDIDEQPMKVIAETLEIPVNTGYSRLRVARGEFRDAIERICKQRGAR